MKNATGYFFLLFLVALSCACGASPADPSEITPAPVETAEPPPAATAIRRPSPIPEPAEATAIVDDPIMGITGPEEIVFDWTTDRCHDDNIPDLAFRAFRGADGQVQGIISHATSRRMRGPDLNNLTIDCDVIMRSDRFADPSLYSDAEWIAAPYSEDGRTVYALVHNEYQGHTHPGQCPMEEYFPP